MKIRKIRLHYIVEKSFVFPRFVSPAIRGIFGHALKQTNPELFKNFFQKSETGAKLKQYCINTNINQTSIYSPNDKFFFDITLFGDKYKKLKLETFVNFENYNITRKHKGKIIFEKATDLSNNKLITNLEKTEKYKIRTTNKTITNRLQINFSSPVCIKKVNKPKLLTFENIVKRIYERLNNLHLTNIDTFPKPDFELSKEIKIIKQNFTQYNVKHYSNIRNHFIHYRPAFIGSADFYGNIQAFYDLLKIGELINIGRGTTSGLGKLSVKII